MLALASTLLVERVVAAALASPKVDPTQRTQLIGRGLSEWQGRQSAFALLGTLLHMQRLRFLFVTALRLRLGLPYPCLATYAACSCGHLLDHLGTHLLRCVRGGERTSSHDSMWDADYHIIRDSSQHAFRERTHFLSSSAPWGRGGRVDIWSTLLQTLPVVIWWSVLLERISSLPLTRSDGRKPTIGIA